MRAPLVRLRQAVLVARDLDATVDALRAELGLGPPYADPGVGMFGLRNAVMALGDAFVEVVSPVSDDAPAARHRERLRGDGGYMLMVQVEDLEGAEQRSRALGLRTVWSIDLPDIAGRHLHPGDIGGTLLSLDRPSPPESWRWGGPDWTGRAGEGAPGRLAGATVAVRDPARCAARWGEVLGAPADGGRLQLDGGWIEFVADSRARGLIEIAVELPEERRQGREGAEIAGVVFRLGAWTG